MEKWIILIMQHVNYLHDIPLTLIEEIAVCNDDGELMMFDTMDEAFDYQDLHTIDGQVIELPIY
jgi:hypothetical protein